MKIFFAVFLGLFYAVGIGILGYGLWSALRSRAAGSWPIAKGTFIHRALDERPGSEGGTMYEVKVEYKYNVWGKDFIGSCLAFGYSASSGQEAHQRIFDALQKAKEVDVRYNPSDPAESTLSFGVHRSIQFFIAFGATWLAFVVGFTLLWWISSLDDKVLLENLSTR
jgi:hypothetical protein